MDIKDIVLGGFGMPIDIREPVFCEDPLKPKQNLISYAVEPETGNSEENILPTEGSKPVSPRPQPLPEKTIYIIPTALALRNPFSKKKKVCT